MDGAISVKRFLEQVRLHMEPRFASACVSGEVSNTRDGGRHLYFTLKEDGAALSCAVWGSRRRGLAHAPRDGDSVAVRGGLSLYVRGGSMTLVVTACEPAGQGGLRRRLLAMEAELRSEGVFDGPRRIPPRMPRKMAVIASLGGAALQDVLRVAGRRAPGTDVLVFPAAAQGAACAAENLMALQEAQDGHWGCDVILMARGGGSMEDLWGYNDPDLARAVSRCRLPIITGIGHSIDTTLADMAADMAAATPSQAAEYAAADRGALLAQLSGAAERLWMRMEKRLLRSETELNLLAGSGLMRLDPLKAAAERLGGLDRRLAAAAPQGRLERSGARLGMLRQRLGPLGGKAIADRRSELDGCSRRMRQAVRTALEARAHGLQLLAARLGGLDPESPLERGFAMVKGPGGRFVKSAAEAKPGDRLRLRWRDGEREASVGGTA